MGAREEERRLSDRVGHPWAAGGGGRGGGRTFSAAGRSFHRRPSSFMMSFCMPISCASWGRRAEPKRM